MTALLILLLGSLPISIDVAQRGADVSPTMYGIFFEEINHAGDGGLYAELVRNRSFEELEMPAGYSAHRGTLYPPRVTHHLDGIVKGERYRWSTEDVPAWTLAGDATMRLTKDSPRFASAPNSLCVTASGEATLTNHGYWGMGVRASESYTLRTIVRTDRRRTTMVARLVAEDGSVLASQELRLTGKGWTDVEVTLVPAATDARACLTLSFEGATVWLDYVSLMPRDTFHGHKNGLRRDVAETLEALRPAFVRWPGGCVVEGITVGNRFDWKATLGDPAARSGEYSTWGYRCSYGFGYDEMLTFCEDIGAKAMYVCNVGMGCQFRMGDVCAEDSVDFYLQDCLDAIEYALGSISTPWGRLRAANGHPEPYPLAYVEIGNENWGEVYDARFQRFYDTIKAQWPALTLISNHGLFGLGKARQTDMIDPHYYVEPSFFYTHNTEFDAVERGRHHIYVGEYACNGRVGGGNMNAALSEAAFILGMERNGDIVKMASYAPLLENRNDRSWAVNLIWLDTDTVVPRSSYYVQQMCAEARPDYNVALSTTAVDTTLFFAAGIEASTNTLIVKAVNARPEPVALTLDVQGARPIADGVTAAVLSAASLDEENSFDAPRRIYPTRGQASSLTPTLPPHSFSVLRVPLSQ